MVPPYFSSAAVPAGLNLQVILYPASCEGLSSVQVKAEIAPAAVPKTDAMMTVAYPSAAVLSVRQDVLESLQFHKFEELTQGDFLAARATVGVRRACLRPFPSPRANRHDYTLPQMPRELVYPDSARR
jgi:hypothetical protein